MLERTRKRISIAIAAMGGQGGGVLSDWIVAVGEQAGYVVQATSVPGVAQRTGSTIYYLELFPDIKGEQTPILALMPIPGDVDIVLAAELAEAGRAVQRGIVTPDRTTLITSTHRYYALAEKTAMGDGRRSSPEIREAIDEAAARLVCFDMQALAEQHGTVISATLFGALAGSGVLPFTREQFEAAISSSGKSTSRNLAAFGAAFSCANEVDPSSIPVASIAQSTPIRRSKDPAVSALLDRVDREFCEAAQPTITHGLRRLLDYQDPAYASVFLDRIAAVQKLDLESSGRGRLTEELARHLALWMSYEDTIRVADLKIRRERFERSREEVHAKEGELVYLTEYMHPRVEELADTLPARAGRWLLNTAWAQDLLRKYILRERKVNTSKIGGFLMLYGISCLRRYRRATYRFVAEQERIKNWLDRIASYAEKNHELALEIVRCQNLVKGYGDTHARGLANFNRIMQSLDQHGIDGDSASLVRELYTAALADEAGDTLTERLKEVA